MNAEPTAPPASTWNTGPGWRCGDEGSYSRPVPNCSAERRCVPGRAARLATKPSQYDQRGPASLRAGVHRGLPGAADRTLPIPGAGASTARGPAFSRRSSSGVSVTCLAVAARSARRSAGRRARGSWAAASRAGSSRGVAVDRALGAVLAVVAGAHVAPVPSGCSPGRGRSGRCGSRSRPGCGARPSRSVSDDARCRYVALARAAGARRRGRRRVAPGRRRCV